MPSMYNRWQRAGNRNRERLTSGPKFTTDELIAHINVLRRRNELQRIEVSTRPSSSGSGTTIEVWLENTNRQTGQPLIKSVSWGVIVSYLRGMYQGYTDQPVAVSMPSKAEINSFASATRRRLEVG